MIRNIAILLLFTALAFIAAPVAFAEESSSEISFIHDEAALLADNQRIALEKHAWEISEKYPCEVRVITVNDMRDYGSYNIEEFSINMYNRFQLGYGEDRSCLLLVLSMAERDYDLRAWGYAKTAFTFYGIDKMLDSYILPLLREDDYYGAFAVYLDKAEEYLKMAEAGTPFDKGTDADALRKSFGIRLAVTILLPLLIALTICLVWKGQMKTARIAKTADRHIPQGGFRLAKKEDQFLYRTVTRRKIERESSSGGARIGGGGSSGRSGKF